MAYAQSKIPQHYLHGFIYQASGATQALNSAYSHYTSGAFVAARFVAPESQTNAALTVYAYCTALAGTAGNITARAVLRNGAQGTDDVDRPEAADTVVAQSGDVACSGMTSKWVTFSIASATLVQGQSYFLLIINTSAAPTTDYPTFASRGTLGNSGSSSAIAGAAFMGVYGSNGFSADGTNALLPAAMVLKWASGTLFGCPYVTTETHASNTNVRGFTFTPTEDLVVSGIIGATTSSAWSALKIRVNGGADVVSGSLDRTGGQSLAAVSRFAPTTLSKGTTYDVLYVCGSAGAGTIHYMGEASPPTDVQNCIWPGAGYVDGTAALDPLRTMALALIVDDNPLIDTPDAANVRATDTVRGTTGGISTRTLSPANDTVEAGYYEATTLSAVDSDLAAANIVSGKTIFGVAGSATGGGGIWMPRARTVGV